MEQDAWEMLKVCPLNKKTKHLNVLWWSPSDVLWVCRWSQTRFLSCKFLGERFPWGDRSFEQRSCACFRMDIHLLEFILCHLGHWDIGTRVKGIWSFLKISSISSRKEFIFVFFGHMLLGYVRLKGFHFEKNTSLYFNPCKTSRFLFLRFFLKLRNHHQDVTCQTIGFHLGQNTLAP